MPSITVKNIPPEMYEKLKKSAEANHRSINGEIIACIERSVSIQPIQPEQYLAVARELRKKTASYLMTDDEFNNMKKSGRL
jgi:antitoxin FitA